MQNFYALLKQLDPEQLIEKARHLLAPIPNPLDDQILADVERHLRELEHTIPTDSSCILWGFREHCEVEARIVCGPTDDYQGWCKPEITLSCESVTEYIHCAALDTDQERWQWFLGMETRVQRLSKNDLADFAAYVVLAVVAGTNFRDLSDIDISAADRGRLNRLRRSELKMLFRDFSDMLPHNAYVVPWYSEKGWSRYGCLQVVDYLPCAVCGSEEDAGGIVHQVYGKRICSSCYAEIKAATHKDSRSTNAWDTLPKARLIKYES